MSVIELDSQDLKDLEDGYMLKIKVGNHECGLVGPKWINAETIDDQPYKDTEIHEATER